MNFKTLPYLKFGGNFTSESLSIIFFKFSFLSIFSTNFPDLSSTNFIIADIVLFSTKSCYTNVIPKVSFNILINSTISRESKPKSSSI